MALELCHSSTVLSYISKRVCQYSLLKGTFSKGAEATVKEEKKMTQWFPLLFLLLSDAEVLEEYRLVFPDY